MLRTASIDEYILRETETERKSTYHNTVKMFKQSCSFYLKVGTKAVLFFAR